MRVEVMQFACVCGAQSEGWGQAPDCWSCGKPMRQWGTRYAAHTPLNLLANSADKRTANGGY